MIIDKSSWERLQGYFDELIELAPGQRHNRLAGLGLELEASDRVLLESLLEAHDRADPLLRSESAPALLDLTDAGVSAQDWTGRRLGPWQVEEQIGRGGMSVVHRGRRADGQFEKTVAIKVLDADQLAADQRHRLTEEVRILARLEHPGLARLIDSGQSDEGDPYLVMEYVSGIPLHDHVEENRLTIEQRIELILQIARALQYAHQRQVIHCDVKPSNILVTPQGEARLVDFGIAALDRAEPGREVRLYCSPAYAAPERLLGAPPTTAQDIFALGAVLYRILSGRNIRPHDSITGTRITEQPTPPSIATTQSVDGSSSNTINTRDLKGDLDAICMKAIAVEPDDRYASVSELIRDLEAWRDHRPVTARDGGRAYVMSRWLRRHTAIAVLGLLLISALIGGMVVALDQARRASLEADRALAARDFLIRILEAADPTREHGHDPTASELLRRGAERIDEELAEQPGLRIELLYTIATAQHERGLINDSVDSLERALSLLEAHPRHPDHARILAARGMAAFEEGDYATSIGWLERALELADERKLHQDQRWDIAIQLADVLVIDQQAGQALRVIEPVLAGPLDPARRAGALRVQGGALEIDGQLARARVVLHEALELQARTDPAHIQLAKIENDLGIVYWRLLDHDRAAERFEAAWRHKARIYGQDHPQTLSSLGNLAGTHSARGDHAGAIEAYRISLEGLTRVHGNTTHVDIAYTWGMLAVTHYWDEDLASANEALAQALAVSARLSEPDLPNVRWLPRLEALLAFESGESVDPLVLVPEPERCIDFDQISQLGRRLCLAAWVSQPAACPDAMPKTIDNELQARWPARWRQHWSDLQRRCLLTGQPE